MTDKNTSLPLTLVYWNFVFSVLCPPVGLAVGVICVSDYTKDSAGDYCGLINIILSAVMFIPWLVILLK